jgi:hypothetical protein
MNPEPATAAADDLRPVSATANPTEMARLLGDFGNEWDIAWQDDGRLGAHPRDGRADPGGSSVFFADTPSEIRILLEAASHASRAGARRTEAAPFKLRSLSQAVGARLRACGLQVTELTRSGEVVVLVVTNPRRPEEGRVVIGRDGLIEWDRGHQASDDLVAAHIAAVLLSMLASD